VSESQELFTSINYIKHKIDAIERIELLTLRSNKVLRDEYVSILQADEWLLKVYKEIDGIKSQKEISVILETNEMMVSRKISKLSDVGLVEIKDISGNQRIYKHSVAEQAYKLIAL
jgi:DNA-binding MarR family transcriptional regulator